MKFRQHIEHSKRINSSITASEFLLYGVLCALLVIGFFSPYEYNILPSSLILEAVLIVIFTFNIRSIDKQSIFIFVASITYIVISYSLAMEKKIHILDYLMAFKAFVYVVFLSCMVNKNIFDPKRIESFFWFLLILMLAKYSYSHIFNFTSKMSTRPGILVENNFELIFLLFTFFLSNQSKKSSVLIKFLLLAGVFILSGSRSGLACFAITFYFIYVHQRKGGLIKFAPFLVIILCGLVYLFMDRLDGKAIEEIDRLRFLFLFLEETSEWSLINWLIGAEILTPLSVKTCETLAHWENLHSFSGDGSCYSVILHSYVLRSIFDHGILGTLSLYIFVYFGMTKKGYLFSEKLFVWAILFATSLSVSSFNSIFVAISIMLIFAVNKENLNNPKRTIDSKIN